MSVPAIDPIGSAITTQASAAANRQTKNPASPAPAPSAPAAAPAATAQLTQIPASVDADDRATYLQLLNANHGNVNAALAGLKVMEGNEKGG